MFSSVPRRGETTCNTSHGSSTLQYLRHTQGRGCSKFKSLHVIEAFSDCNRNAHHSPQQSPSSWWVFGLSFHFAALCCCVHLVTPCQLRLIERTLITPSTKVTFSMMDGHYGITYTHTHTGHWSLVTGDIFVGETHNRGHNHMHQLSRSILMSENEEDSFITFHVRCSELLIYCYYFRGGCNLP